jgi:hypothetical protein
MKYFMGWKFSPAGPRKLGAIIVLRQKKARLPPNSGKLSPAVLGNPL